MMDPRQRIDRQMRQQARRQRRVEERLDALPDGTTAQEAARVAYEAFFYVTLSDGESLRPKCGGTSCINPEHMELVSPKD